MLVWYNMEGDCVKLFSVLLVSYKHEIPENLIHNYPKKICYS